VSTILERLQAERRNVWLESQHILDTAEKHSRTLSSGEQAKFELFQQRLDEFDGRIAEVQAVEDRNAKADEVRDLYKPATAHGRREDDDLTRAFRSAILSKNPAPIEIPPSQRSYYQPGVERRDLLKTTATQALPVSTYDRIVMHLLEGSAVLRAGATVINTETGEDLQVPKSTAFSTAAITSEGAAITESDPTLAVTTLKSYKYSVFFQVSHELAKDGNADLLGFVQRQAGEALSQAFGAHLMTGSGTGQPWGAATRATAGKTGPTGTSTSFGTQATAGQGTDLLNDTYASLAEPYVLSPATGFVARNATIASIRNLKTSAGELVGNTYLANSPAPWYVDPFVAAMGASAKSVIVGDWSRYFVRIAGGLRFERSDDFAFQNDMVSFRAVIRLDGDLVDTNALKAFVHSAT
jgi:HK97 family phage major capsid protein